MPLDRRSLRALLAVAAFAAPALSTLPAAAQPIDARQQMQLRRAQQQQRAIAQAAAQLAQAQQQAGVDPKSFEGKDSTEGVYVRDSALAQEKFALAQKMERLKEWNKSADLYQE